MENVWVLAEHARQVRPHLPIRLQNIIDKILERNVSDLKQGLEEYGQQVSTGLHKGAAFWVMSPSSSCRSAALDRRRSC